MKREVNKMKIERNDRKKVFVKDVDYSTVVQINDQYYMPINKESFELFGTPFISKSVLSSSLNVI